MTATKPAVRALLSTLGQLLDQLPLITHLRIDINQQLIDIRPRDYLDARHWAAALGGPAEPDRIVWAEAGAVWWHTDCQLGAWTVHVDAREELPRSVPISARGEMELDDPAEAMLDALEMLAWQTWYDRAKAVRESALAQVGGAL